VAEIMTTRAAPKSHHVTTQLCGQHVDPLMTFGSQPEDPLSLGDFGANDVSKKWQNNLLCLLYFIYLPAEVLELRL